MGIFGKKKRDDEYIVTTKSGSIYQIEACRMQCDFNENVVWFYSSSMNRLPQKISFDEIVSIESNGKVVSIPVMLTGAVCGGMAGAAVMRLMKDVFKCNIGNPLLAKAFMVVFVGGTAYLVGCAVANELTDQAEDFIDKITYIGVKTKEALNKRLNKGNNN